MTVLQDQQRHQPAWLKITNGQSLASGSEEACLSLQSINYAKFCLEMDRGHFRGMTSRSTQIRVSRAPESLGLHAERLVSVRGSCISTSRCYAGTRKRYSTPW